MKKSNIGLVIVLVVMMASAWSLCLVRAIETNQKNNQVLEQAKQYSEKTLYQKAIACYDTVLIQNENKTIRALWVEAYKNAYNDGVMTKKEYADALSQACNIYPKEADYWTDLLLLYIANNDFNNAYKNYVKCNREGVTSDTIEKLGKSILYTYTLKGRSFSNYVCSTDGYYTVFDGEEWGVMDASGEFVYDNVYQYISPFSKTNMALFVTDEKQYVMGEGNVVEEKLQIAFTKTGTYSNGLMAICAEDGTWRYLNCASNSYLQEIYEQASNFSDGIAAVCKEGKWMLINTAEEQICRTVFSDIKLHKNGDYVYDDIMVAAINGEYGLYNAKGEALCEFKAKDMDVYLGEYVAFADAAGKWGFVNKSGEVVIEPQFDQAKSFSGKLAAVANGQQWGFVDKSCDIVIDLQFVDADYFTSKGTCMVSLQEGQYNMLKRKFVD